MRARSGAELLALPVRLHGIHVGRAVELLLDGESLRTVGLDVLCKDEVHRFLPFPTARLSEDSISISSPFVLLEEDELEFYRSHALTLSSLRGRSVERGGRALGTLQDVLVASSGDLVEVVVGSDGRADRIPFDLSLELAPKSRTAA